MTEPIGIIAGSGEFPRMAARSARAQGRRVVVCGFVGHTDPALEAEADAFTLLHLGQLGKLIEFMKSQGVREICLAGAVSKPKALDLRPDLRVVRLLFSLRGKGDDAILRALAGELEREGLRVVQASQLVPELRGAAGALSSRQPGEEEWEDIRFGWPIAQTLGKLDIGQALVVRGGIVVAVEAMEGTDETLARGGRLGGKGCTLIKIFKPGQDERLDQPAIGAKTIEVMARHGYACLAFEAGNTLFFEQEKALALADKAGIAVIGLPRDWNGGGDA